MPEEIHEQKSSLKRPSSPVSSNQSSASKQIRYSSPNSQTNNCVPQSASNRNTLNSLSSLSQLSQSIGQNSGSGTKDRNKEREEIKDISKTSTSTSTAYSSNPSPQTTYAPIFSTPKSQLWSTSSSSTASNGSSSGRHLSSPSIGGGRATPVIGLSSLHNNHLAMFASPIPPVSLPSVGGAVAPSATPSPFIGDSLFSHQNQDFLRRELDTRFLASQDRTINIPPPPYMRPELHPHMHLPQSQPFPPAMPGPLVSAPNSHMYEKYPKLDQTFYGRNALGLPGFPSLSPLLSANVSSNPSQSGLTASANTPFGTPGHSAAFQPKLNSLSTKAKPSVKSGRWCAMHVRIAWEIYHHQQKQHMDFSHKAGIPQASSSVPPPKAANSSEMLRPLNHLFPIGTRTQDLPPFSSALLNAATSRAAYDSPLPSHHNQFGPTPPSPHLSNQSTNFARFPTLGSFGALNSSLNLTPVVPPPTPSATLFGPTPISASRDLPIPGCLPGISASGPELWPRNVIPRPTSALMPPLSASMSASSSPSSSSSWGGLKAEAERNRDDIFNKRKATDSVDKEAKRFEREKQKYDDRLETKHRDQSHGKHSNSSHLRNGDIYSDNKNKEVIKSNNVRTHSGHTHHNHSYHNHNHNHSHNSSKGSNSDLSAFDNNKSNSIGVKNEQKEDLLSMGVIERERDRLSRLSSDSIEQKLKSNNVINPFGSSSSSASNLLNSSSSLAAMGLNNQLEKARLMNLFGLQGTPPPMSPHFTATTPTDPLRSYWNPLMAANDPFKNLHDFQMRPDFLDRENIFQRYSLLNSSGGGASLMEKLAKESAEKEMLSHSIEKHNSKLLSHLRANEPPFPTGLGLHSPHTSHPPHLPPPQVSTPSSSSSAIFPANPYLNSLHSLSASAGSYVKNKTSSLLHTSSSSSSEPSSPSIGPPNGNLPALIPNVLNHSIHSSNLTNSKLSIGSLIDSPLEAMKDITHKTNESNSSSIGSLLLPNGSATIDVLETNSR